MAKVGRKPSKTDSVKSQISSKAFGKLLFTWLSLVMSMMVSFVLSFFPRDVLDEILNLIESVSEDFPSYSYSSIISTVFRYGSSYWNILESFYIILY